jgi:hypothetical protein
MGNKFVSFASTEIDPQLGNALRKFGRAWHSIADGEQAYVNLSYSWMKSTVMNFFSKATSECVILGDSLGYQGMNSKSAKVRRISFVVVTQSLTHISYFK